MENVNIGDQMDLPLEEEEAPEVEPEVKKVSLPAPEYERDCPVCGGSGSCYACDRGREFAASEAVKFKGKKKKARKKAA